ncbi:MAG: hypothetical protein WCC78_18585, partial [Terriglobales bacterium]
ALTCLAREATLGFLQTQWTHGCGASPRGAGEGTCPYVNCFPRGQPPSTLSIIIIARQSHTQ